MPIQDRSGGCESEALASQRRRDPRATSGLHQISAADDRRERVPVGHGLSKRREIWLDPGILLIAAGAQPKSGLHLVEDQRRAVLVAEGPRPRNPLLGGESLHDG